MVLMPSRDPAKNRQYVRDHYARHPDRVKAKVRARNIRIAGEMRTWVAEFKASRGCAHCGMGNPLCLQFHHCDGEKEADIAKVLARWSKTRLLSEIEKCVILCANCHLIEHANIRASGGMGYTSVLETDAVMA